MVTACAFVIQKACKVEKTGYTKSNGTYVVSGSLKYDNAVTNRMVVILMFVPLSAKTIKQHIVEFGTPAERTIL